VQRAQLVAQRRDMLLQPRLEDRPAGLCAMAPTQRVDQAGGLRIGGGPDRNRG
jgi:hypothetical protein